ncbi:MAG: Phenylacetic acid catabolic protein [Gammaproteobacteria bacterium]
MCAFVNWVNAERMTPQSKKPLSIFEFPLQTWPEFCVIKLLADLAEILQVEDLVQCSFVPLRNLARMTMPEERFHAQFGAMAPNSARRRRAVQDAIDRYFPMLVKFFGQPNSKNNEIYRKWGIKQRSNEAKLADYLKRRQGVASIAIKASAQTA